MKVHAALIKRPHHRHTYPSKKHVNEAKNRLPYGAIALGSILSGLFCGVLFQSLFPAKMSSDLLERLSEYLKAQNVSFGSVLWSGLLPSVGLGLFILYLGASPVGSPVIAALLWLRGCAVGALAAFLASAEPRGLLFYFACQFPAKALQLTGLFLVSRRAIQLSFYYKSCLKRDSFHPEPILRRYLISCLPGLLLLFASVAADAVLFCKISPSFGSLAG